MNSSEIPEWTGHGFRVGDQVLPILSYGTDRSGWTDELTTFHEGTAGDSHFIDKASRRHAVMQVAQYTSRPSPVILDVGCSSGFLLHDLKSAFPAALVAGTDIVLGPLLNLSKSWPEVPLLHFDLSHCPLPDNSIDVAILLNVLEHIQDDALAVQQVYRILKPGGIAIIEVPAGPELYDIYDELLMHYRRYKMRDLRQLFLDSKFEILHQSHLGFFLYPAFFLVKYLRRHMRINIPTQEIPVIVGQSISQTRNNPFFHTLMVMEFAVGKVLSYPFGIRCLLTCIKVLPD